MTCWKCRYWDALLAQRTILQMVCFQRKCHRSMWAKFWKPYIIKNHGEYTIYITTIWVQIGKEACKIRVAAAVRKLNKQLDIAKPLLRHLLNHEMFNRKIYWLEQHKILNHKIFELCSSIQHERWKQNKYHTIINTCSLIFYKTWFA